MGFFRTDQSTAFVSLTENGRTKRITDYDYAPPELRALERDVEATANIHRWIHDATARLTLSSPVTGPSTQLIEDLKNEPAVWIDVHSRIKPGLSKLMQAAGLGNLTGIRDALQSGDKINARDETGWTPLMVASVSVQPEAVALLLDSGAEVNQTDDHGNTALIGASAVRFNLNKEPQILQTLLTRGALPEAVNDAGESALMWAARAGNPEAIDILLKRGADPRRTDRLGNDALFYLKRAHQNSTSGIGEYDRAEAILEQALKQDRRK